MGRYTATLPLHSRYTPASETICLAARHFALLLHCYTPTLVEYGYIDLYAYPFQGFRRSKCYSVAAESAKPAKIGGYAPMGHRAATPASGWVAGASPAHVTRTRHLRPRSIARANNGALPMDPTTTGDGSSLPHPAPTARPRDPSTALAAPGRTHPHATPPAGTDGALERREGPGAGGTGGVPR